MTMSFGQSLTFAPNDLILTQRPAEDTDCLEFVFNLSSVSKYREGSYLTAGQHRLLGVYDPGCEQVVGFAQEPTLSVDIHLHPKIFQSWLGLDTKGLLRNNFMVSG